ncbi:high mobility group B protein 10 isoform X2 [Cynara cardunculus var. scolymus]|uniref:high mobility group B protein 10 isoform X2 n=1 Tax=Cynara cardunculus var. scolymus TaxID=59895 RepID=UPI000D629D0A|nr:high mobility group B protein 10 isoform X2 [Cynara cardunculus var. scolymus]
MSAPHLSYGPKTAVFTNGYGTPTTSYPSPEASYEEITQNPQFFLEKLQIFHSVFGTKFKIPIIGGKSLDLHRLFIEVTSRGGIEKVYYFRKKTPTIVPADATNRLSGGSGSVKNLFSGRRMVEVGGQVTGTIDKRFDHGYVVTVDMGSEKLSGFLYHLPSDSPAPSHGTHNMYQLALREPSPEPDTSGYDVFFTEHYIRLKPLYHGQENVIRKRIQVLWSTLTEEEKQVYQEKGSRGKER